VIHHNMSFPLITFFWRARLFLVLINQNLEDGSLQHIVNGYVSSYLFY